jgi:Dolichyl-phosphate-mannose-protein mannosyltransferase
MVKNGFAALVKATIKTKSLLVFTILIGLTLRVFGVTWGFPGGLHPDEYVIVQGALDMIRNHNLEPAFYYRPDHVEIQLSYWAYQLVSNVFIGADPLQVYVDYPGLFLLISRLITVAFGVAMVPLAYAIGKRVNPFVANGFAIAIAIFLPLVQNSHYATPDVPQAAMFMVLTLALMKYVDDPKLRYLALAGWATAVATAAKYPGALGTIAIAAAVIYVAIKSKKPMQVLFRGFLAFVFFVVALWVTAPALFNHFDEVIYQVGLQSTSSNDVASGLGFSDTLIFYVLQYALSAGVVLTWFTVVGLVTAIRIRKPTLLVSMFGVFYLVFISLIPLHWPRWAVPVWPALLFFAVFGLSHIVQGLAKNGMTLRARTIFVSVLAGIMFINGTVASVTEDIRMNAPDTRLTSSASLAAAGATEANTIFEGYTPLKPTFTGTIFDNFNDPYTNPKPIDSTKKFILISGCVAGTYQDSSRFSDQKRFYTLIDENYKIKWQVKKDVGQLAMNVFEPLNIANRIGSAATLLNGGQTGCDLTLYATGK